MEKLNGLYFTILAAAGLPLPSAVGTLVVYDADKGRSSHVAWEHLRHRGRYVGLNQAPASPNVEPEVHEVMWHYERVHNDHLLPLWMSTPVSRAMSTHQMATSGLVPRDEKGWRMAFCIAHACSAAHTLAAYAIRSSGYGDDHARTVQSPLVVLSTCMNGSYVTDQLAAVKGRGIEAILPQTRSGYALSYAQVLDRARMSMDRIGVIDVGTFNLLMGSARYHFPEESPISERLDIAWDWISRLISIFDDLTDEEAEALFTAIDVHIKILRTLAQEATRDIFAAPSLEGLSAPSTLRQLLAEFEAEVYARVISTKLPSAYIAGVRKDREEEKSA